MVSQQARALDTKLPLTKEADTVLCYLCHFEVKQAVLKAMSGVNITHMERSFTAPDLCASSTPSCNGRDGCRADVVSVTDIPRLVDGRS